MTLAGSKTDSYKFYHYVNLVTCIALLLYGAYITEKAEEPNVNNGFDSSQKKAVILVG